MSKKILVVDDEPDIVAVLEMRLNAAGYDVVTASDGQEGLTKAQQESPDLVIMDVMMPKMDGMKACALLKADQRYKEIPVVLLTARVESNDKQVAEQIRADAYLNKPFDAEKLLATIKDFIGE